MMLTGVHSGLQPQASKRKFLRISIPYSVCLTSGWNWTPKRPSIPVLEGDDGDRGRLGGDLEAFRDGEDGVSVARPGLLLVGRAGEEALVALDDQVGPTVLPDLDGPHLPALDERHELHPVTDAEHRHSEVEEVRLHARRAVLVDAVGAAGEDDALGVLGPGSPLQACRKGSSPSRRGTP